MTITRFTAEQNVLINEIIQSALAATADTPLEFHSLKPKKPYVTAAREQGFTISQASMIGDLVLQALRERRVRMQRKEDARLRRKKAKEAAYKKAFSAALKAVKDQVPERSNAVCTDEMAKAALLEQGLRGTRAEIVRLRGSVAVAQVHWLVKRWYRAGVRDTLEVKYRSKPKTPKFEPTVSCYEEADYNVYGGSFKGWAARSYVTDIIIRDDYASRVMANGLRVVADEVVLDATPLKLPKADATRGIRAFSAYVVAQHRGNSIDRESRYIVTQGDIAVSSPDSLEDALQRLAREMKRKEREARKAA